MLRASASVFVALLLLPVAAAAAGRTVPLIEAVKQGDVDAVRALLEQQVEVDVPEPDGSTALHWAAHQGDYAAVDLLLRAGASAVAGNRYGVTPLALAAASGDGAVVERLLEGGADPNTASPGGETVLMTAASSGRSDAVRVLLAHGADVNAREGTRLQTALMWAAASGHAEVVRQLIDAGADLRAVSGGPSLTWDATGDYDHTKAYKRPVPRLDTFTPLQFAVREGQIEATRALLDAGASLEDETPQGLGLLALAIANAHYELAALLVERGADVNAAKVGFTPLHQLVRVRNLNIGQFPSPIPSGRLSGVELGKVLLQHGADVDARTTKSWVDGHRGRFGLNATPFLLAAKGGDVQMMLLLAAHGADPLVVNSNGTTAVMAAAGVAMLNPNEDSGTDADGLAALRLAVALGGDVNAMNVNGDSALHGAVHRPSVGFIEFLAESGARLEAENKDGVTPLQLAVGGLGIGKGARPKAAALLRDLMVARGLTPDAKMDEDKYSFGVTVR